MSPDEELRALASQAQGLAAELRDVRAQLAERDAQLAAIREMCDFEDSFYGTTEYEGTIAVDAVRNVLDHTETPE